ncbi:MAG: hypothetical protein KatS3mg111_3532 [Pirellulaceae bacterium]|nr:MAG: hypothetical protein KatS3mg111_3532 [Pirellulaceae bacterium]
MPRQNSPLAGKALWMLALCLSLWGPIGLVRAENEGQAKLDEATELKLSARTPDDLGKVIRLCEEALEEGLDEANAKLAKQILAATALQRAELMIQQIPRVARNPSLMRQLRRQAMSDLRRAIDANPELAQAHLLIAQLERLPGGNHDAALQHVNKAIELLKDAPVDRAKALLLRAALRESNEDRLKDLAEAIATDPTNTEAWQARIALQIAMGKMEEALEDARKMLEREPDNVFALQAAVQSLLGLDKVDEAVALLSERIEQDAENGALYRARSGVYVMQEKYEEALADLDKAIELDDNDIASYLARAQIYLQQDEYDKANHDVSTALLIEPNNVQGVLLRAIIAGAQKRYADAIADLELLVRFNPSNEAWVMQLAAYYQMDNRPRKAIELLDQLIKQNPEAWRAYRLRGDAKLSISEHRSAIDDYQQAIDLLEKQRVELGDEAVQSDLDYSGLLNNLSWVLSTSPDDSIRDGQRALELALEAAEVTKFEAPHILSTLAAAYAELGDFDNARKWAAKAVELGEQEENEQLEQLKQELESYRQNKPWREEQNVEENQRPVVSATDIIDT